MLAPNWAAWARAFAHTERVCGLLHNASSTTSARANLFCIRSFGQMEASLVWANCPVATYCSVEKRSWLPAAFNGQPNSTHSNNMTPRPAEYRHMKLGIIFLNMRGRSIARLRTALPLHLTQQSEIMVTANMQILEHALRANQQRSHAGRAPQGRIQPCCTCETKATGVALLTDLCVRPTVPDNTSKNKKSALNYRQHTRHHSRRRHILRSGLDTRSESDARAPSGRTRRSAADGRQRRRWLWLRSGWMHSWVSSILTEEIFSYSGFLADFLCDRYQCR